MTKANEMQILDEAIAKLGNDSYLGDWLASVRFEAESLMRSDILPEISILRAEKTCKDIKSYAESTAETIRETAKSQAGMMIAAAKLETERIKNRAADSLRVALREMEN